MKISLNINKAEREALTHNVFVPKLMDKIEAACIRAENPISAHPFTLRAMTWYIAEVAFSSSNPVHRCIAFHRGGGTLELIGSYDLEDMPIRKQISDLAYFRPIRALPEMFEESDPSGYPALPKDAPQIIYIEK